MSDKDLQKPINVKLYRDSIIYKRIENLEKYEKRKAIEEEFHCREDATMYCRMYDTHRLGKWKPILDTRSTQVMNSLWGNEKKYFKSILLLGDWYDKNNKGRIFTIEKEVFTNFGHIPFDEDMGEGLDKLNNNECHEYVKDIWWNSEKKAILSPNLKIGSYFTGVNINDFYIELSTGMTKDEAKSFALKAIEELYENSEKYKSELSNIDIVHSMCDFENEKVTNTNWADMFFIYDYINLYSEDGKIKNTLLDEIHNELLKYHNYDVDEIKQVGAYSLSHVRNWVAKIKKEIGSDR